MLREIASLLYPWPLACTGCGGKCKSDAPLCPDCSALLANERPAVGFADALFTSSAAAHSYTGPAAELVRLLKYNSCSSLAADMARDMLAAEIDRPDVIAFVPMHWLRRRGKHFNQAELLAKHVAQYWNMRPSDVLRRTRPSRQQARIRDAEKRLQNVRNAFAVRGDISGKRILLIDDVYTTGATSGECARALLNSGAAEVRLLVYARTV